MLSSSAGEAGINFLTEGTFNMANARANSGGGVERYRLLHNMLSSQPMCFNLFAPLAADQQLGSEVCRALIGCAISNVREVRFEWAPSPIAQHLNDKTSFDCFIEYETAHGELGFLAVETKLTEPFSPKRCDAPAHRRWMTRRSPWRSSTCTKVASPVHNQLWRNHLLAWSLLQSERHGYSEGHVVVVHHPDDEKCSAVVNGYRDLLRDASMVHDLPLNVLLGYYKLAGISGEWLEHFRVRYLALERSERDWLQYQQQLR